MPTLKIGLGTHDVTSGLDELTLYEVRTPHGETLFRAFCISEAAGFIDGYNSMDIGNPHKLRIVERRFKPTGAARVVRVEGGAR